MAKSRLIGGYPVIGIRPTIDGRRGVLKVRESLEEQTMNMARAADHRQSCRECRMRGEIPPRGRGDHPDRDALLVLRLRDDGHEPHHH